MSLSAAGIGSGLDINAMVSKIVEAERAPKQKQINESLEETDIHITAYGQLKSALNEFKDTVSTLSQNDTFSARSATSSASKISKATITGDASPSRYNLQVTQLAQFHKIASGSLNPQTEFETGTLTLTLGTQSATVNIVEGKTTLPDIAQAINQAASKVGISASIINEGTESRLLLTSDQSGEDYQISVVATSSEESTNSSEESTNTSAQSLSAFSYQTGSTLNGMQQLQAAQNANITLDNLVSLTSSTNTFSGAITGVDIEVFALTDQETPTVEIAIEEDSNKVRSGVDQLVESYNSFYAIAKTLSEYNANSEEAGPLSGDSMVRLAVNQLTTAFSTPMDSIENSTDGAANTLIQFGITGTVDGTLNTNNKILDEQLRTNFEGFALYFEGDKGLLKRLETIVDTFTGAEGAISNRETSLNDEKKALQLQESELNQRMKALEERTLREFNAMDQAVSKMRAQLAEMENILKDKE